MSSCNNLLRRLKGITIVHKYCVSGDPTDILGLETLAHEQTEQPQVSLISSIIYAIKECDILVGHLLLNIQAQM